MPLRTFRWSCLIAVAVLVAFQPDGAAQQPPPGNPAAGRQIYNSAVPKCSLCHKIGQSGGKVGPDLSAVGTRRDAAWLMTYLPNPQKDNPKNKMPAVKVKGQDLADLVAYLRSLRAGTR